MVSTFKIKLSPQETYAVDEGDNPIETMIAAVFKNPDRKLFFETHLDPTAAIEKLKRMILITKMGQAYLYTVFLKKWNVTIKVIADTRLAEDLSFNPFK
jgi:hypothetical protein